MIKNLLFFSFLLFSTATLANDVSPAHGIAMHGKLKYPPDFTHLEYTNPAAPKGGELRLAANGTFDSTNPFIIKGIAAPGINGLVYQTLMQNTDDEAFSEYGLIAETIETPDDRSWAAFNLRKGAKWSDGTDITADDVVWTFKTLVDKGHPSYRAYYSNVKDVVAESKTRVKFIFNTANNRELPLIVGQMPVLPRHFWDGKDFATSSLDLPMGSGPYKVASMDTGRRITFERIKNWWGEDLPLNKGRYNFDTIIYDLYRDETVLVQALFSGNYDVRQENIAKSWHTAYDQPPVRAGLIKKEEIHHEIPAGMQGFVFNIRKDIFSDIRVRKALGYAFDFEWSNKKFAFDTYKRTASYFANSELASSGLPQGRELDILEKFKGQVPEEVFTKEFKNPSTSGSGQDMRDHLSKARTLLKEAGWVINKDGLLEKNGRVFSFEVLLNSATFERWIHPFIANLKKLGITATVRTVDTAQYKNRTDSFDFDMMVEVFGQSLSPGNEQRDYWTSEKADIKGSRNVIGIKNPAVDALVEMVVSAPDRDELIYRTRALDRVLLWNYYVIPNWHLDYFRVASWDKFGRPAVSPKYGLDIVDTWWYDQEKAARILKGISSADKK